MVYGCGNKCIKFLVFFFNFLVFVAGVIVLGVSLGIRFNNDIQDYVQKLLTKDGSGNIDLGSLYIPLYVLMAIGSLLILTGFVGCCGAWVENTCLLAVFFAIVLILFIAELGCGIAVLVKKDDIRDSIFKQVTDRLKQFDSMPKEEQDSILGTEKALKCCGCHGPQDYSGQTTLHPDCLTTPGGCCDKVWNKAEGQLKIVGGVAIGILVIELLAMIFSCILCQAFKRGDYQYA